MRVMYDLMGDATDALQVRRPCSDGHQMIDAGGQADASAQGCSVSGFDIPWHLLL